MLVLLFEFFCALIYKAAIYISSNNTKYDRKQHFNTQKAQFPGAAHLYSNKLVQLQYLKGRRKAAAYPLAGFQCHERVIVGVKLFPHFLLKPISKMQSCSDTGAKLKDQQRSHLKIRATEIPSTPPFILFSTFNHLAIANLVPILVF